MDKNLRVYKSNAIIEASFRLSVAEQRVILSCISQIQQNQKVSSENTYSISATELSELTGSSISSSFRDLKNVVNRLFDRYVLIKDGPNGRARKETLKTRWIQSIFFIENEARVELRFSSDMIPYLNELTKQFTRYKLSSVVSLETSYSFRFYEFICQWLKIGKREFPIQDLRDILQIGNKYPAIKDFKRRVLEPAINDINKNSDLWIKWNQIKTGRKVTHLIFEFGLKKKKNQVRLSGSKVFGIDKFLIEKKARPGETYEEVAYRLRREKAQEPV